MSGNRLLLPLLLLLSASPDAAALESGRWLSVKGRPGAGGSLEASSIEPSGAGEVELRGRLSAFDPPAGRLRLGPFVALLDEDTDYDDAKGRNLDASAFRTGSMVKVTLEQREDGRWRVEEVKQRESSSTKIRVVAPVESVRSLVSTELRFRMLGVEIVADEDTDWEGGLTAPRLAVDDEDARPAENIPLGRLGTLSGEVRLDLKSESNYDLTSVRDDDLETARLRTDLEFNFPSSRRVAGMLELRAQSEWVLHDEAGQEDDAQTERLRLGETWIAFRELFRGHGTLELGRLRWDDDRDWWYRANLDSVRLRLDWPRLRWELAYAEQVLRPTSSLRDARHLHLRLDIALAERHRLSLIALERESTGPRNDLEGSWHGAQLQGRIGDRVGYRLDYAQVRGELDGEDLHGEAVDVTTTVDLPGRWEPTLTLGYARASDDFRQTGLHDNNAKFGGITSLRYLGEVFRPELANIRVSTLGVGVRPRDWLSFEVFWHDYRQDAFASRLVDTAVGSERTLRGTSIGEEWNLVAAWERYEHWELELNLGVFQAADSFLGGSSDAWLGSLKVKYVF